MALIREETLKSAEECRVVLAWLVDSGVNNEVVVNRVLGTNLLELILITDRAEFGTLGRPSKSGESHRGS
jgi:hypothetical protein